MNSWYKKTLVGLGIAGTALGATFIVPNAEPIEQPVKVLTYDEKVNDARQKLASGTISVRGAIAGLDAKDKANIKGEEIAKKVKKEKVKRSNYDIEIVDIEPIEGGVQVFVRAWQNGKQIGFGTDGTVDIERFRIINPPVLVPDPNGDIVQVTQASKELGISRSESRLREDPKEAIMQTIESNLSGMKNIYDSSKIVSGKVGNTTTTVYSGASDEYVYANLSTWSGSYNSGGVGSSNTATILAIQASKETSTYVIYRSPMPFDTSAIGSDTISAATFYFTPQTINDSGPDDMYAALDKVTTITPATGDYALSNWASVDQATRRDFTGLVVDTESSMALNATGISNINGSGTTNFGMRASFDMDNTTPTGAAAGKRLFPYASEQTGTTKDPRLVIEHSAAAATETLRTFVPQPF